MRTLLIFLSLLIFPALPLHAAEGIPLYEQLRASIVTVQALTPLPPTDGKTGTLQSTGAGVILDANGTVATNTHVVFGSEYIRVTLKTGETLNARVLFISPDDDLALLQVTPPRAMTPITWADSNLASLGEDVVTIGHSDMIGPVISGGHIKAIGVHHSDPAQTPEFFELDINHYEGDSGNPVFDKQGRFLGMMNAKITGQNRACLVIPANKIHFAYLTLANKSQTR